MRRRAATSGAGGLGTALAIWIVDRWVVTLPLWVEIAVFAVAVLLILYAGVNWFRSPEDADPPALAAVQSGNQSILNQGDNNTIINNPGQGSEEERRRRKWLADRIANFVHEAGKPREQLAAAAARIPEVPEGEATAVYQAWRGSVMQFLRAELGEGYAMNFPLPTPPMEWATPGYKLNVELRKDDLENEVLWLKNLWERFRDD